MAEKLCLNCGRTPVRAKGLCAVCYMYRRHRGVDRPEALIVRQNVRDFDKRLTAAAWGGPVPEPQPSAAERLQRRAEEATRERRERLARRGR